MNWKVILVLVVVLVSLGSAEAFLFGKPENIQVWGVDIVEQTPPTIPGIALEQASDARVRLFLTFYPLSFLDGIEEYNITYNITDINVYIVERERGIKGNIIYRKLGTDVFEEEDDPAWKEKLEYFINQHYDEDLEWTDLLTRVGEFGVATVSLDRLGSGRRDSQELAKTAEEACLDEDTRVDLNELLPDQLDIEMRADIAFTAKKYDGTYLSEEEITGEGIGYTADDVQRRADDSMDRWVEDHPDYTQEEYDVEEQKFIKRYTDQLRGRKRVLRDTIYFNTSIGIDKTNIELNPEQVREQICESIKFREFVQGLVSDVKEMEEFHKGTCLLGLGLATVNTLFSGNPCDSWDYMSLGCDWIFCPKSKCNGIDPFYSLVGSTLMCWKMESFFNKEFIQIEEGAKEPGIEIAENYNVTCKDKAGDAGFEFPHFWCVSGARGNLELIDLMTEKYQECLIKARYGGVSVGVCDKLRSYYFCDRIIGGLLTVTEAKGGQGLWSGITDFFTNTIINGIVPAKPGDTEDYLDQKSKQITFLGKMAVEEYTHVPFLRLFSEKDQYMKHAVCNAFVEGKLFDLEDIKSGLLTIPYPDNYYVLTEKRVWDYNDNMQVNSYSYDTFYQIFAGTAESYGWNNYYVFLKGKTLPDEFGRRGDRPCTVQIASGSVPDGELAQDNIFKVSNCNAIEHCIRFRGRENCNPIGIPVTVNNDMLDPFGLTLFGNRDDVNKNGIADSWEELFGITDFDGDDDGDGCCNVEEYHDSTEVNNKESMGSECSEERCDRLVKDYEERGKSGETKAEKVHGEPEEVEFDPDAVPPEDDYIVVINGVEYDLRGEEAAVFSDTDDDGEADEVEFEGETFHIGEGGIIDSGIVDEVIEEPIVTVDYSEIYCEDIDSSACNNLDVYKLLTFDDQLEGDEFRVKFSLLERRYIKLKQGSDPVYDIKSFLLDDKLITGHFNDASITSDMLLDGNLNNYEFLGFKMTPTNLGQSIVEIYYTNSPYSAMSYSFFIGVEEYENPNQDDLLIEEVERIRERIPQGIANARNFNSKEYKITKFKRELNNQQYTYYFKGSSGTEIPFYEAVGFSSKPEMQSTLENTQKISVVYDPNDNDLYSLSHLIGKDYRIDYYTSTDGIVSKYAYTFAFDQIL